ncbi:PDZ domain-containing protein [Streptomyces sp. ST2-7A]|uniref:YlbL family protein n=1 Tax=Streptomyces sp. ST2-7A TaxID=2907214 RepID=UPI001F3C0082|nr:PDZ domain-containing protein [Streptomyces sp. ST2-7A]MCE7082515.1 PDZ domain-containing protein [Streptomyces sp. ST2-7A]
MPRRTASLLTSGLLLIGLLFAAVLVRVPYAEMSPGPTVNTLGEHNGGPVLNIAGEETYETTGNLNMTTVRVTGVNFRMSLFEAVRGWLAGSSAVVPHETLYPERRTADEVEQINAEEFSRSQETAKVSALLELGYEVGTRTIVSSVVKDGPAEGVLRAGDVIVAVDGEEIGEPSEVAERVTAREPGDPVVFTVDRVPGTDDADGTEGTDEADGAGEADPPAGGSGDTAEAERLEVTVTSTAAEDDGRPIVGISAGVGYDLPFDIDIELADVGGPSAGLMFALGLVDKLTEEDLTGGEFVAGTGTITAEGRVGPIGGVAMKIIAAREQGASWFLTPAANCAAAAADPPAGLTLVEVETLEGALDALEEIRAGAEPENLPLCSRAD